MVSSERFRKLARHLSKEEGLEPEECAEKLRGYFFTCTRELPESLQYDLFDHLVEGYLRDPGRERLQEAAERMSDMIDLFHGEYDDEGDPLPLEEWDFVRDAASDSGEQIDVRTLTYVMQRVVDHGRI